MNLTFVIYHISQESMKTHYRAALIREHEHMMRLSDKLISTAEAVVARTVTEPPCHAMCLTAWLGE